MGMNKRILAIALTVMVSVVVSLGAMHLNTQATQGHGPDNNQNNHPHQHDGRAYQAGSRCVNTHWADEPHASYSHAAYTQGPRQGTHPVASVTATAQQVNDELGWEVRITWQAPRHGLEADAPNGKKTYACQPHTYIIQRSLNGGAWADFASSRRSPATVVSSKRIGVYGPDAAYSTDELGDAEPTTRTPVRYRVCGRHKSEKDDGVTYRACVTSNTVHVGPSTWEPRITADSQVTRIVSEETRTISFAVTARPAPPADFTSNSLRTLPVTAHINQPQTQGTGCPSGAIPVQTQDVRFDTNGKGTFILQNPKPRDTAFTDDCRFTYSIGDSNTQATLYIKEADRWPLAINATPDEIDASGGTVTSRFEIEFTGSNGCPALANVKVPVTASERGNVEPKDFTVLNPITIGHGDCAAKTAVNVSWSPPDETSTTSTEHGTLVIQTDTSTAVNTFDQSQANVPNIYDAVTFTDSRTIIKFQHPAHYVAAQETVKLHPLPKCTAGVTGTQAYTPYRIKTNETPPSVLVSSVAKYVPSENCFAEPITFTPSRDAAGTQLTAEISGPPANTSTARILTGQKTTTIYVTPDVTTLVVTPSNIWLTEGGQSRNISVRLSAAPTEDVTVPLASGAKFTAANADTNKNATDPLTFTSVNWERTQQIVVSANHDNDPQDEEGTITLTAGSDDTRFAGENASVTYTIKDDDKTAVLRFSSFNRPTFYADSDGNTDEANGYDDDAYVKLDIRFPARNTDTCYVEYISMTIRAQGLKNHYGYRMAEPVLNQWPFYVPYGDDPGINWAVSQKSGYKEYTRPRWPGIMFHHYDDEVTDSAFIYHDNTPGDAKEGTIKSYAIGNVTKCNDQLHTLHPVDVPLDGSQPTLDSSRQYGPYHRVNFPVE